MFTWFDGWAAGIPEALLQETRQRLQDGGEIEFRVALYPENATNHGAVVTKREEREPPFRGGVPYYLTLGQAWFPL